MQTFLLADKDTHKFHAACCKADLLQTITGNMLGDESISLEVDR